MVLNFSLRAFFCLTVLVMLWHMLLPYTMGAAIALITLYLLWVHHCSRITIADGIFVLGILFNLWFVLATWGNVYQYDYYNFYMQAEYVGSHSFFISAPTEYFRNVFFQPPLWGFISAFITKIAVITGHSYEEGFNFVRFISFYCVGGVAILLWRMMNNFGFASRLKNALLAFFLFFPINGLFSGLVNNDAITYFLMMAIVYVANQWVYDGTWRQTINISLLLLMAGMTKFSGLMVLPAIGALGLYRLVQSPDKKNLQLWNEFIVIGLGAFIGFMWGFFLLYYKMPLVPPLVDAEWQKLSAYTEAERWLSIKGLFYPFVNARNHILEPNMWLSLVKTSLFGEWAWANGYIAYLLYILGFVWAGLAVLSFFALYQYKTQGGWSFNLFAIVLTFSVLISWLRFGQLYPYFCSTEFRYIAILFPVSLLWFGNYINKKKPPKSVNYALAGLLFLFISARIMLCLNTIGQF